MCGCTACSASAPCSRPSRCCGSAGSGAASRFYDAQCDDARLVLATARSAMHHGALVANYTAVLSLERTAGRVVGVQVEDRLTGARGTIRANVVVNATGPWADRIRTMEDSGAARLLQPTKGVHILVDRSRLDHRDGDHLPEPDRWPGALHPPLARPLLHRHHRYRHRRVAGPAPGDARRDGLSPALGQRPLPQREARPRGRPRRVGRPAPLLAEQRGHERETGARASTRSCRARVG